MSYQNILNSRSNQTCSSTIPSILYSSWILNRRKMKFTHKSQVKSKEELEMEKLVELRKEMEFKRKLSKQSLQMALHSKEYQPTHSAQPLTHAEEFHFRTDTRLKNAAAPVAKRTTDSDFVTGLRKHNSPPVVEQSFDYYVYWTAAVVFFMGSLRISSVLQIYTLHWLFCFRDSRTMVQRKQSRSVSMGGNVNALMTPPTRNQKATNLNQSVRWYSSSAARRRNGFAANRMTEVRERPWMRLPRFFVFVLYHRMMIRHQIDACYELICYATKKGSNHSHR